MSYTASSFFERYITQQYRNTITNYYGQPVELVERYYFALNLSDQDFNTLASTLPVGSVALKGALLYYNKYYQLAYAVIFYYSGNTNPTGYSFSAAYFVASNWPSSFDPKQYVCDCRPVNVPPGVQFATTSNFYETNSIIPICNTLQYRIYPDLQSQRIQTFDYAGNNQTIQSSINAYLANVNSRVNETLSISKSVQKWTFINARYIEQIPPPEPVLVTKTKVVREETHDDVSKDFDFNLM
jgi:hypothetical protein